MKTSQLSSLIAFGLFTTAYAFPDIAAHLAERDTGKRSWSLFGSKSKRQTAIGFDAAAQYISNTGSHEFVAPGSGDQRGPCPGLNALANHNYLPHDGVATIDQYVSATNEVYNMGLDLGTFLSTYGAVFDGDLTSWSMGGPASSVASLAGLTGTPQGISGSHNKYESDASPTRGDLYQVGNDYEVQLSQFKALYELGMADDSYDLGVLTTFRQQRFQQSISENPYFFYGPFTGVLVSPAAYTFIYRYMGNKSAEYPEGQLNGDVLKSFFAITGDYPNFEYQAGWERIPDNWYTRNVADPYGIPELESDTNAMGLQYPAFLVPGGNTGTTNSYVGLDPSDLSGGVYNLDNIASGNNAMCLALELTVQAAPDTLSGLFTNDAPATSQLGSAISSVSNSLGCPQLTAENDNQYSAYPGYTKLNSDGSY